MSIILSHNYLFYRLRRDSEAVSQRPAPSWEEGSREGRDSVVTTSSGGSASSSETLKWHGSMSDVSVSSGLPARQPNSDRWDHGSMSDISSVNGLSPNIQKSSNNHDKWQSSLSDLSSTLLSSSKHSRHANNKWKQETNNKWQASMNDRNCKESSSPSTGRTGLPAVISHCASVGDVHQATSTNREGKWQESSIDEDTQNRTKVQQRKWETSPVVDTERYNSIVTSPQSPSRGLHQNSVSSLQSPDEWDPLHGSMSDVSQANLAIHNSSKQLIAHSARVQTPQRHHSESVLYLDRERSQRKFYSIGTTQPQDANQTLDFSSRRMSGSPVSPQQAHLSVAERISELEKQQQQQIRYTYLDPEKRHRVSDPTLKAIQKKALLSFYERHHQSSWRSEPQLAQGTTPIAQSPPPQPPPRPRPTSSRRASSASDYSSGAWREKTSRSTNANDMPSPKHQHSNSCGSLSTDLLGPVIVGPTISIDDWVPERPPKKPHLRAAYNDRVPSPDLPPPSPPTVTENEVLNCDDPLPPPPPELSDSCSGDNSGKEGLGNGNVEEKKRLRTSHQPERQSTRRSKHGKRSERDERTSKSTPSDSSTKNNSTKHHHQDDQHFIRSTPLKHADTEFSMENGVSAGFATHRMVATGRSSLRYPSTQKLMINGRAGPVKRITEERHFSSRPPARLPDLISQRYSDSGNQRPAPQVPVESRIIRQESMRVESTRIDASGLLRNDATQRFESSSGQRPQPQVPKNNSGSEKSAFTSSVQQTSRPNYLALSESVKNSGKYSESTTNHGYSVGSPIKTGYEASSKLMAEASPQKYHEPPKYVHHQHHGETSQRNYYAMPSKYMDGSKQKPQPQCPTDRYVINSSSGSPPPPPLAPRQNTPGRKSLPPPPRPAPPQTFQG